MPSSNRPSSRLCLISWTSWAVWPTGIMRCRFSQRQQLRKVKSIQVSDQEAFFHLMKGFQKHPKASTYLIKEHLDVKNWHLRILKSWSPCSSASHSFLSARARSCRAPTSRSTSPTSTASRPGSGRPSRRWASSQVGVRKVHSWEALAGFSFPYSSFLNPLVPRVQKITNRNLTLNWLLIVEFVKKRVYLDVRD